MPKAYKLIHFKTHTNYISYFITLPKKLVNRTFKTKMKPLDFQNLQFYVYQSGNVIVLQPSGNVVLTT